MIFQRHSFNHNFLNAVETDPDLALDVLVNEINELVLDHPRAVTILLRSESVRVPNRPTAKDLAVLLNEQIAVNENIRTGLAKLIQQRHVDAYVNCDGGTMDKDFSASGPEGQKSPSTRISTGIGKTYGVVENVHDTQVDTAATKKVLLENLETKMGLRGMSPVVNKTGKIIIGCLIGAAVIGTIVWIYKSSKK